MTKETYHHEQDGDEAHQTPWQPEFTYRYEDGYDAEIHASFASLSRQFSEYAEGPFAAYNVPVWIEYDSDAENPNVSVGLILTRHGLCMIWRSPATPEEFRELQVRMLGIWAGRADAGFGRFLISLDRRADDRK